MLRKRGFTLIELLVVIAIIAILATLVITQLGTARVKARNSSARSDVTEMGKAVELFKNDNDDLIYIAGVANAATTQDLATPGGNTCSTAAACTLGTLFDGSAHYKLKINKAPTAQYTYIYKTVNAPAATYGTTQSTSPQNPYQVGSNIKDENSANNGFFYIMNGTSYDVAPGAAVTMPAAS